MTKEEAVLYQENDDDYYLILKYDNNSRLENLVNILSKADVDFSYCGKAILKEIYRKEQGIIHRNLHSGNKEAWLEYLKNG